MAVLPEVLPGITGLVAQVGNAGPPVVVAGAAGAGSIFGAAAAERQYMQDCADVRIVLHVGDLRAIERKDGRGGDRSDAGGIGKDEFRIRETTQG